MSSYDQNLLDEAPRATRAQLQEGYNVDLLEQPPRRTPSTRVPPPQIPQPTPVTVPLTQGAESGSGEKFSAPTYPPSAPKPRTSFWRSRNGIITIVVLVLVVIGAVVGGAVGGTVTKNSNNNVAVTSSPPSSSSAVSASTVDTATQGMAGGGTRSLGAGTLTSTLGSTSSLASTTAPTPTARML